MGIREIKGLVLRFVAALASLLAVSVATAQQARDRQPNDFDRAYELIADARNTKLAAEGQFFAWNTTIYPVAVIPLSRTVSADCQMTFTYEFGNERLVEPSVSNPCNDEDSSRGTRFEKIYAAEVTSYARLHQFIDLDSLVAMPNGAFTFRLDCPIRTASLMRAACPGIRGRLQWAEDKQSFTITLEAKNSSVYLIWNVKEFALRAEYKVVETGGLRRKGFAYPKDVQSTMSFQQLGFDVSDVSFQMFLQQPKDLR